MNLSPNQFHFYFTFTVKTNGTHSRIKLSFVNTSTVLSWSNLTYYIINGSEIISFIFNATAATPGNYNFTVTTLNGTGVSNSNVSIVVNDTTDPSAVDFVSPTNSSGVNLSLSYIIYNVSVTDNGVISTIIVRLHNSTRNQINSSNTTTSPLFGNFSGLSDGTYYINA